MKTLFKRLVSMLLVFVLVLGLIPSVYAATDQGTIPATEPTTVETTVPAETAADETTPTTETTESTEASEPIETTEAAETTKATEPSTEPDEELEETKPTEAAKPDKGPLMMAANNDGIMLAASTQSNIMLFDFADNGNYTTVLNSQLAVSYKPNGSGTTRTAYIKNLGWHFARYGNVPYADDPLYCIEPWRNYGASTSGNSVDRDVTLSGSSSTTGGSVWYSMPEARRKAIGLILLYSNEMWDHSISVTTTKRDSNPNVPLRIATQFLIYEIVCGLRDPDTFQLKSSNECGTEGDIFYNAGVDAVSYFAPNYNNLVSYVQAALEIPSFTSSSSSTAPVIQMNSEEISVYDSNGVLSDFSFTDKGGVEFYKSGNTLYITQTGTINESTVHNATKYIPSAENSTYCLWYMSNSTYQTTISLYSPESGSLNAYFKVKGPAVGDLSLTKTTEDGMNLSGWRFGIYSNSACTSLVSGPHTTGSTGKINISGLAAGTYYVKELGHTDSAINSKYVCSSTNPQKVTISAGSTASVSFVNNLNQGNLALTKTTSDNQNLSGWQFSIYSDSACSTLVSGPHTTDANGKISVTGLIPGTYYVKEIGHSNATYDICVKALEDGANSYTHTFNAMSAIGHREPGVAGAALATDGYAELICDGIHVCPAIIHMAYHAKTAYADKFVLVTDSIPPAGLPNGNYEMNGIQFTLQDGKAAMADGTIVGSALDMMTAIKNLVEFAGIRFEDALICATKAPAEMVGLYETRGSIAVGKRADLILCDKHMNIREVFCAGTPVYN